MVIGGTFVWEDVASGVHAKAVSLYFVEPESGYIQNLSLTFLLSNLNQGKAISIRNIVRSAYLH
jgi:hypothetical protein